MHANAAGISIHESRLNDLLQYADTVISDQGLQNTYLVDYIFDNNENFGDLLLRLTVDPSLWGNDIYEPKIVVEHVPVIKKNLFIMGTNKDSVKWTHNGVEYVRFKDTDFINELQQCDRCEITVYATAGSNEWAGRVTPQLRIEDWNIIDTSDEF